MDFYITRLRIFFTEAFRSVDKYLMLEQIRMVHLVSLGHFLVDIILLNR